MIFGIGAGIVETERVGRMAARGRQYLATVFTAKEIDYCESKARSLQHYAARLAAKGAAMRALKARGDDGLALCDIEAIDDERGKPELLFHGKVKELFEHHRVRQTSVSLSHSRASAIAVVILQK